MASDESRFKMPLDYNFSTRGTPFPLHSPSFLGKNWAEYYKDFILRTDSVWEKEKLRDYFRLYMKCFYFDKASRRYHVVEPEDLYTMVFEHWALEDVTQVLGYTPTGRTVILCF